MTIADLGTAAGAVLAVCAVVGLAVRFVLLPYLRDQVVKPVQETHRQVTPHDRPLGGEPTIVDRLDDIGQVVEELREASEGHSKKAEQNRRLAVAAGRAADAAHRRITDHEAWAREEDRRLWGALSNSRHSAGSNRKAEPQ